MVLRYYGQRNRAMMSDRKIHDHQQGGLRIADCGLRIADYGLRIFDFGLQLSPLIK